MKHNLYIYGMLIKLLFCYFFFNFEPALGTKYFWSPEGCYYRNSQYPIYFPPNILYLLLKYPVFQNLIQGNI